MRYYKNVTKTGTLLAIGTGPGGTEITEAEYNELLTMIREKARLVYSLYSGLITIDEVPQEWREEVQRRVDERRQAEAEAEENAEATEEDFVSALAELGVSVHEEN